MFRGAHSAAPKVCAAASAYLYSDKLLSDSRNALSGTCAVVLEVERDILGRQMELHLQLRKVPSRQLTFVVMQESGCGRSLALYSPALTSPEAHRPSF
jgi:hypothetical protein